MKPKTVKNRRYGPFAVPIKDSLHGLYRTDTDMTDMDMEESIKIIRGGSGK